jgi:hypothetical protein
VDSPALGGLYFNADFCSGRFWGLGHDPSGAWVYQELLNTGLLVTGAGEDERGELYVTSCTCTFSRRYDPFENATGAVWRLVAADAVPAGYETAPIDPVEEPGGTPVAIGANQMSVVLNEGTSRPKTLQHAGGTGTFVDTME